MTQSLEGGRPSLWGEVAALPHELRFVDAGRWRTRVLIAGQGSETLILSNGTSGHLEAHFRNVAALAGHFRVIIYDSPGHGYTTQATADLELSDYEQHLLDLMDALGIESAHIGGESLGGWIAVKFAAHHPERVAKLVLTAPGGTMLPPERLELVRSSSQAAADDPSWENVRNRMELVMASPGSATPELVSVRQAIYRQPGYAESMRHLLCLQDPVIRQRNVITDQELAAIPNGALVVWTDNEPAGPPQVGKEMAEKIPDGDFELIVDAAHWPQWEQPEKFNDAVIGYLTGAR